MVWAKLDDAYGDDCARLSDAAFRTHTEGLGWTMRRVTEGHITARDLRRFAETADPETAVAELTECGWWKDHPGGDGWQIVHDMDHQRTREQIEADRAATADRQRRWREAHGRKKPKAKPDDGAPREDVERICQHLAARIEAKGSKRPSVTKTWRDEARLMLDNDGRPEENVHKAIDWCQDSGFWHSKVMSVPKLREKFDQLRLEADQERKRRSGSNGHGDMRGGARQELLPPADAADLDPGSIV
jgi:hypothetical protein